MPEQRTEQVPFVQNLAPGQGVRLTHEIELDQGEVVQVTFHFPAGCNALVDIAFGIGGRQILPTTGVLSLNDATPSFYIKEKVKRGAVLWVQMANGDAVNPHNVSVVATAQGGG
jgi:hypothetical protein